MLSQFAPLFVKAFYETLIMVGASAVLAFLLGLPLALLLVLTAPGGIYSAPKVYQIVGFIVDGIRSTPFIVLLVLLIPLTRLLIGTSIGVQAAIVPLTLSITPYFARIAEISLREVPKGLIEAAQAMGCERPHIVRHVLLPEAMPGIAAACTICIVSLFNISAMAGVLGAGGLGDLAIRYGFDRYEPTIMFAVVAILFVLVAGAQKTGDSFVKYLRRNI